MTQSPSVLRRLITYLKPYRAYLFLSLILAMSTVFLSLYTAILVGRGVDCIVGAGQVDFSKLLTVLFEFFGVIIGVFLSEWLLAFCNNRLTFLVIRDIRRDAFKKLVGLPLSYIDSHPHGDIISRLITDADQIANGLLLGFTQLFSGIVTVLATLGFMFFYNYKIALAVLFITPLSFFITAFIARKTHSLFLRQSEIRGELTAFVEETVGELKTVKAFSQEHRHEEQFDAINKRLQKTGVRATFCSSIPNPSIRVINNIVYIVVAAIGAFEVISGAFTVGRLSCFLTYANKYTKPFNEISGVITELQSALASAKRLFSVMDEPPEQPDVQNALTLTKPDGRVSLINVAFSYDKTRELIKDFNLQVYLGQRIAIVGPTGCGKTTLINLLMRFYEVDAGEIAVSGLPVPQITRDSLRKSYGMVLQETYLFHGTIYENIAYGNPNATREQVLDAARRAHANHFIERLPDGYDTVLSDADALSQGQKQLLCIARVMLTLPPMLILDEATSSIDTRTELKIQTAFHEMMTGRTSFIVAHRLSTIKEADCILVMNNGQIVDQGTHDELLRKGGFYARLYQSQFEEKSDNSSDII